MQVGFFIFLGGSMVASCMHAEESLGTKLQKLQNWFNCFSLHLFFKGSIVASCNNCMHAEESLGKMLEKSAHML